jgi:hypothetical protein
MLLVGGCDWLSTDAPEAVCTIADSAADAAATSAEKSKYGPIVAAVGVGMGPACKAAVTKLRQDEATRIALRTSTGQVCEITVTRTQSTLPEMGPSSCP